MIDDEWQRVMDDAFREIHVACDRITPSLSLERSIVICDRLLEMIEQMRREGGPRATGRGIRVMAWRLTQCSWPDRQQLNALLADGWEPFATAETEYEPTVWLRQNVARADAKVVVLPRRPQYEHEAEP